jgi:hypothetical protein
LAGFYYGLLKRPRGIHLITYPPGRLSLGDRGTAREDRYLSDIKVLTEMGKHLVEDVREDLSFRGSWQMALNAYQVAHPDVEAKRTSNLSTYIWGRRHSLDT